MCRSSLRPVLNVHGEPKDTNEFEEIRTTILSFSLVYCSYSKNIRT